MTTWQMESDTLEDITTATLHRLDCVELDRTHELELHPAGSAFRRDSAPRECWTCRPTVRLRLDSQSDARSLD